MAPITQLGMIGTTFRRCGQDVLQYCNLNDTPWRIADLHQACGFLESVYIATCNRVEIIFVAPADVSIETLRLQIYQFFYPAADNIQHDAARMLHAYADDGAAEHLFRVAASLDSMIPGEAQILGQVKDAFREAQLAGLCKKQLTLVFEEAFQTAKKIRCATTLGTGTVSMVSLLRDIIANHLQAQHNRLLIVGVGDMAQQCAKLFFEQPGIQLLFVNRTLSHAQTLAANYGGSAMALDDFLQAPVPVDVIFTATSATHTIFDALFFKRLGTLQATRKPLLIDMSLHRDIDCNIAKQYNMHVYDIDALEQLAQKNKNIREAALVAAHIVLEDALQAYRRRVLERDMAPAVHMLRTTLQQNMDQALAELLPHLTTLDANTQNKIQQWAQSVVQRMAHVPTVGLKNLAHVHGIDAVESFLAGTSCLP